MSDDYKAVAARVASKMEVSDETLRRLQSQMRRMWDHFMKLSRDRYTAMLERDHEKGASLLRLMQQHEYEMDKVKVRIDTITRKLEELCPEEVPS
jgi:hypothetical protein